MNGNDLFTLIILIVSIISIMLSLLISYIYSLHLKKLAEQERRFDEFRIKKFNELLKVSKEYYKEEY